MKRINIMTSCDNNLAKYILPQLVSIDKNLNEYDVHFYLVHSRIQAENVKLIEEYAKTQTALTFREIKVTENLEFYESLVYYGGNWPQEAYFTLLVENLLPEDVDRVMYIDAGDVIIDGDISPYYFDDFCDKSIIATAWRLKTNPITQEKELYTNEDLLTVARSAIFNSGSYVINVEKNRKEGYTMNDYIALADLLKRNAPHADIAYYGDQGYLSAAFVGDIKFFDYPRNTDLSYMPYCFTTAYWGMYKKELDYRPIVIHYAIMCKPWVVRFSEETINDVVDKPNFVSNFPYKPIPEIAHMTAQHLRYCEKWWEHARETPIYEEANLRATITAESWLKHFLPMCAKYIRTAILLDRELEK